MFAPLSFLYEQLGKSEPLDRLIRFKRRCINTAYFFFFLEAGVGGFERVHDEVTFFLRLFSHIFIYFISCLVLGKSGRAKSPYLNNATHSNPQKPGTHEKRRIMLHGPERGVVVPLWRRRRRKLYFQYPVTCECRKKKLFFTAWQSTSAPT